MINKTLHYFWDADRPAPDCVSRWPGVLTDGWTIKLWTPDTVEHKDKEWLIENKAWAILSGVARLQAMVHEGGVYLDRDVELIRACPNQAYGRQIFFGYC